MAKYNMRYQTIDRCKEPGCRCLDTGGIVLYDGPSRKDAERAKSQARYDNPKIVAYLLEVVEPHSW